MNIFVQHDAAALAAMTGAAKPACDSIMLKHGDARTVLASSHSGNPLGSDWLIEVECPSDRIVAWSGTLADELFESDPRTWGKPGRDAFRKLCDELAPQLTNHARLLCFYPHARHVLNDVPSCLTFLRDRANQPFEIALAPATMFEPSMLDRVEEHLQRQFESLGDRCGMVLLSDVNVVGEGENESRCEPVALGEGRLPRDVIRSLLRDCVPSATPIVVDGRYGAAQIHQQIEWLRG